MTSPHGLRAPTFLDRLRARVARRFTWKDVPNRGLDGVQDWSQPLLMRRLHLGSIRLGGVDTKGNPRRIEWGFHVLLRADNMSLGTHDHPWNFWSIVLWGGYTEAYFPDHIDTHSRIARHFLKYRTRRAGSMAFHWASYTHAIAAVHRGRPCLTFFITWPRTRVWGFPERNILVD